MQGYDGAPAGARTKSLIWKPPVEPQPHFWPGASFTSSGQNAHRPNEYGSTQALRVSYGAVDKQPPKQFWRNQHTKGPVSGAAAVRRKRRE
ncbi:hypothetical protein Anapl_16888 [Anas platyrhynchos]|uniref:Uncharacterized protein n=1 Tax=Anas platyrhynchos TaxID=8839 RepID=R0L4W2_ANAPL|nr:hypothetical protein Anapl_16888 [Anas platyrhynchos]